MLYREYTKQGSIIIRKPVIGRIVLEAVNQFQGRAMISNHKGKIVRIKHRYGVPDASDHMDISYSHKGLDLRIFIAIRFGTSISMVTEQLIQDIKQNIEKYTGIEANSIAIVVTGLISKQLTRRNIEVKG